MKHPVELKRYKECAKLLRGALDMGPRLLFDFDGRFKKIVRGRGPGSRGNSCGRGMSGSQKHKSYQIRHMTHGGQVPFYRVFRKHKLSNVNLLEPLPSEVTLDHIQKWIENGSLDPDRPIDMSLLVRAKLIESCEDGVKLVASEKPHFCSKINIVVTEADLEVIKLVEQYGGKIQCRYYTREELSYMSTPREFVHKQTAEPALPKHRDVVEYYCNPMYRGYLVDEDNVPQPLLKIYRDAHEQNQEHRPLPENLSQERITKPDEVSFAKDPRVHRFDYISQWHEKRRLAFINHRGTDQFAKKLLRADAVKVETAL
ncbi:uncharacterized protein LOC135815178 [Sycon ciliatum]|uniref:uncharacterized protein LOC135815178 n=1 Tax=Sycon ciliatum TaxID=27933 RepID=UPI0020AC5FC7|eukprot:scpid88693/ scgid25946/ 54S ribosomal protein L10, mitochondrial